MSLLIIDREGLDRRDYPDIGTPIGLYKHMHPDGHTRNDAGIIPVGPLGALEVYNGYVGGRIRRTIFWGSRHRSKSVSSRPCLWQY